MWSKNKSILIIWALLLIQLVAAGTTRQGRRAEGAAYPNTNEDVDADGFHTFTRQGVTLRIQPRTRTIRIDGRNASPAQLLEQAKQARQLELLAVRQLLNTRHPVKRTSFENGRKQTSTYTLEPDGSIVCKIVDDIDMADVDRRFEEIFQKQREKQAKEQPNKIADWEWSEDNDEPAQRPIFRAPLQPYPAGQPYVPTPPQSPQPAEQQPTFYQPPRFQPAWPTRDQGDPFNPPGLPAMNSFDDDEEDLFDAYDKAYPSPVGPTNTVSNTSTDKDGNVVHTTLTTGPNEWKRKTVKTSTNTQARPVEEPSTTVRNIPNLDDFLREQYNPSPKAKPESVTPSTTTSTTPKIIKTINVQDLPPIALLNPNKQLDEEFLQPLTPNADGEQPRPIKTLWVDNIPPSSVPDMDTDRFEQRKVQTLTKTIHGNQMPTAADLDPKMLDMLQRAGITPEDIANANGQTIKKTRVEPGGRTVTTTYRINRGNTLAPSSFDAPNRGATYPEDTNSWRPYGVPSVFRVSLPPKHQSASHFGVDFTPFSAGSVAAAVTTTTTARPLARDREPLEPQDEDNENSVTLNPLLIHPVQPVVTKTLAPSDPNLIRVRSPIAEFLVKCGLSVPDLRANKGEYVRTFLDPDGSVLTARFILTGPIMYPVLNY